MSELDKLRARVERVVPEGTDVGMFEALLDHERQQSKGRRESAESWRSFALRVGALGAGALLFYRFGLESLPSDPKERASAAKELLGLLFAFLAGFGLAKGDKAAEKKE